VSKIRVVQVATGTVGTHSLRTIVGRRDMELVGLLVFTADKVGKDAGELIGADLVGVQATDDFDEILALDADAVAYNALGDTLDPELALRQLCLLLESGKNVCSTAVTTHIYPQIIRGFPLKDRLQAACEKGGVSFHSSGINPGYMMDVWPIMLGRVCRRIDTLYMTEMVDMSRYTSGQIAGYLGYGKRPEEVNFELPRAVVFENPYFVSVKMLADAMGLVIDDATFTWEGFASDKRIVTPVCTVEPGSVGAVRVTLRAFNGGKLRVETRMLWVLGKDVAPPDWPYGDGAWSIRIDGDPSIETRIDTSTSFDARQPDVLMTGAHAVNAIPAVVAGPVGVLTHRDLPLFSGGFFGAVDGGAQTGAAVDGANLA
jgi:2,4-diaminopentanoate dehydrogenase